MKLNLYLFSIILLLLSPFSNAAFTEPSTNKINITFGAGFTDATSVTAVGGNYHTTLGEQRKEVIRRAAQIWAQELHLTYDIHISVDFTNSYCASNSANLGSAGPSYVYLINDIWYPTALANQISQTDYSGAYEDIHIDLNAQIDQGCFSGASNGWYYGLDNTPSINTENLLSVVVHELAHGLGFLTMTNTSTGAWFSSEYPHPDSYSQHLYDNATNKAWVNMSDSERLNSGTSENLAWNGSITNTYAATILSSGFSNNRVEIFSPTDFLNGSSLSHFSIEATPNQVMEPYATNAVNIDIESRVMKDIGWDLPEDATQPVITINDTTINIDKNTNTTLTPLNASSSSASVGDTYMYQYTQLPTNGSLSDLYSDTPTYTPNNNFTGTDVVKFIVHDQNFNISEEGTFNIIISEPGADAAPVANNDSYTFDEDATTQTLNVLANDTDDNSLNINTVTITSVFTAGDISLSGGNILVTPYNNVSGNYSFTYTVLDDANNVSNDATVSLTISPINDVPVAVVDSFNITEDHLGYTLDLISNDNDVESTLSNDDITIISEPTQGDLSYFNSDYIYVPDVNYNGVDSFTYLVNDGTANSNTVSVSLNITSVNDAPVSIQDAFTLNQNSSFDLYILSNDYDNDHTVNYNMVNIDTPVSHGTLTLTGSMLTYVPDNNYFGDDAFSYYLNDGSDSGNSVVVNLTISHVNAAPTAQNDNYTLDEDTQTIFNILDNDTDDVTIDSISIVSDPQHGELSINNNILTYQPDDNYYGNDSFTYKITDDESAQSNTATVAITINSVNDLPVANNDNFIITNGSVNIYPLLNDTDEDINSVNIMIDSQPINGLVSVSGSNVTYLADENFVGFDSFTYHLSDNENAISNIATVNVEVSSDMAPVTNDLTFTVDEDSTNNELDLITQNESNEDVTQIIITVEPNHGVLVIDGIAVTYTPDENYAGSDSFNYQIKDSTNLISNESTASISVTQINDAPIAVNDSATVLVNNSKNINVLNNDWDENISGVTIEITSNPEFGSVSIQNNQIVYMADDQYAAQTDQITYIIIDTQSLSSNEATVDINISLEADLPIAYNDQYSVIKNESIVLTPTLDDDYYTTHISMNVQEFENGSAEINGLNLTVTPNPDFIGTLSIVYNITDELSQTSNNAMITVEVIDDNIPTIDLDLMTLINTELQFNAYAVTSTNNSAQISISQMPKKGFVSIVEDEILYEPFAAQSGIDNFAYVLTQTNNSQIQISVTVELLYEDEYIARLNENDITIINDVFTVIEDTPITLDVLFNDGLNNQGQYQINIVQQTMIGQLTVDDQSITYQPNANVYGADSFTYKVIDTQTNEESRIATVMLEILSQNDVPTSPNFNIDAANTVTLDLFSNAVDVDGTLVGINIINAPQNGLLILSGNQATYTAFNNYSGADKFVYNIVDNQNGVSDQIDVNITVKATSTTAKNSNDAVVVEVSSGSFNIFELIVLLLSLLSILIIRNHQTTNCYQLIKKK
ncbi:Ig-like domain-containing protein [Marinicellulosiphila megalodicopiae]|uniref:Ig-like domain-containing protein n=1 Tax=Marinicellulosiphila megalodicopiae TaxID=2724896 RepID=UPI003BB1E267